MTSILAYEVQGVPVLLADVLLTVPSPSQQATIDVPTFLETFRIRRTRSVIGTVQKIVTLGTRSAVGFAASDVQAAIRLVLKLKSQFERRNVTILPENVEALLSRADLHGASVDLLGWLTDANGHSNCFIWSSYDRKLKLVPPPYAIGTGANDMLSRIHAAVSFNGQGLIAPEAIATASAFSIQAVTVGQELNDNRTISEFHYGGAFQAVVIRPHGVLPVQDYTVISWLLDLHSDKFAIRPTVIRHVQAHSEALFIRSDFPPVKSANLIPRNFVLTPSRIKTFDIPSPQNYLRPKLFPRVYLGGSIRPDFCSSTVANIVTTVDAKNKCSWHEAVVDINGSEGFVQISENQSAGGSHYYITMTPAFCDMLTAVRNRHKP